MNQTVIFKDYDEDMELEVAASGDRVEIHTYVYGNGAGATFLMPPCAARELARVLNLFATFAEAEGVADAKE